MHSLTQTVWNMLTDWTNLVSIPTLLTALISALLGALITHTLTRKRAKDEWVRQRVFDAVADLNEAHSNLVSEASPLYYSQPPEPKTLREWRENVDMKYVEKTIQYSRQYNMALERLRMLIPGKHKHREMLEVLRTKAQTYFMTCIKPLEQTAEDDKVVTLRDITAPIHETYQEMENWRTALMQSLSKQYWNIKITTTKR